MEVILFDMGHYIIYTDLDNLIILTGSLLLQGLLVVRILFFYYLDQDMS